MPKVELENYTDREQAYVKHCLLESYLPTWAYKVGSQWKSLIYVDGFAGPWGVESPDCADSSFGVAVSALRSVSDGLAERGEHLPMRCVLVEKDRKAYARLAEFAKQGSRPGFDVEALSGEFVQQIPEILKRVTSCDNPFKFVFLDPKGWSEIPMRPIRALLNDRSCEVLINLMTRHIKRFLEQPDREASYNELFGRDDVLPLLKNTPNEQRVDVAVREYCRSLQQICNFKFVSSAVILEPGKEDIRYFLVYATNHPRGVEVFKNAEFQAARIQDQVRQETRIKKTNQWEIFSGEDARSRVAFSLAKKYKAIARKKVLSKLLGSTSGRVLYSELFCEAMGFPLVTPSDLHTWIVDLGDIVEIVLIGSPNRKKPNPEGNDWVRLASPARLEALLASQNNDA